MKMDTHSLPDDPTPADAPPSYDTLGAGSSNQDHRSEKYPRPVIDQPAGPSRPSLRSPLRSPPALPPNSPSFSSSGPTPTNNKEKERAGSWFGFIESPQARTTREVRTTVLGLVRDLIQAHNSPVATEILQSCADACAHNSLSLSSLLQEKSIEKHTPFYWAIIKRMPDGHHDVEEQQGPDLLSALISYASPLTKDTITELRLACLTTSDQVLFQRLRLFPEFAPASGADRVLFGMTIPPESIEVEDLPGDGVAFVVNFAIPHFYKRMVVNKDIALEFIARGRMWRLTFFVAPGLKECGFHPPSGSWCVSLSVLETSQKTYIDSTLLVSEVKSSETPNSSIPAEPPSPLRGGFPLPSNDIPKVNSDLSISLKSRDRLQPATSDRYGGVSAVLALEQCLSGANIRHENRTYIGSDETLRARLEARVMSKRPDGD